MAETEGGAAPETQATPPAATPPPAKTSGSDSALMERYEALQKDIHQERQKLKAVTAERDQYKNTATTLETKDKKRSALDKALGTLGEDFYIDEARRTTLLESLEDLNDGPNLAARVQGLVDLAKLPKVADNSKTPFQRPSNGNAAGSTGGVPSKAAKDYTPQELAVMARNEPDRYKEIRAERDKGIGFGAAQ